MNIIASQLKEHSEFALDSTSRKKNSHRLLRRQFENACDLLESSKRHCCMTTSKCTNELYYSLACYNQQIFLLTKLIFFPTFRIAKDTPGVADLLRTPVRKGQEILVIIEHKWLQFCCVVPTRHHFMCIPSEVCQQTLYFKKCGFRLKVSLISKNFVEEEVPYSVF